MNLLHLKYAVEVANTGTLGKAAERLLMAQPNLSRAIKELETDLGISIFNRTWKGMTLTPDGEEFIGHAKEILQQIHRVESMYKKKTPPRQKVSLSVPRASYISEAFARFSQTMGTDPAEYHYRETDSLQAIHNILNEGYRLGIIRYAKEHDRHFRKLLKEKGLEADVIAEFRYTLIFRKDSPLATPQPLRFSHLQGLTEIAPSNPYIPSLFRIRNSELPGDAERTVVVSDRGAMFDLLTENPNTYLWGAPLPKATLQRWGLMQRDCPENQRIYTDALIYRTGHKLTEPEARFINELEQAKKRNFS